METVERGTVERRPSAREAPSVDSPTSTGDFLVVIGARVRRQRALVHMSRRRLAQRSGVSERYLAQLETGRGNMSIVLLRKVALALQMSLADLVAEHDVPPG